MKTRTAVCKICGREFVYTSKNFCARKVCDDPACRSEAKRSAGAMRRKMGGGSLTARTVTTFGCMSFEEISRLTPRQLREAVQRGKLSAVRMRIELGRRRDPGRFADLPPVFGNGSSRSTNHY